MEYQLHERVVVVGLVSAAHHNGKQGRITLAADAVTGRYVVALDSGTKLNVQACNLSQACMRSQVHVNASNLSQASIHALASTLSNSNIETSYPASPAISSSTSSSSHVAADAITDVCNTPSFTVAVSTDAATSKCAGDILTPLMVIPNSVAVNPSASLAIMQQSLHNVFQTPLRIAESIDRGRFLVADQVPHFL